MGILDSTGSIEFHEFLMLERGGIEDAALVEDVCVCVCVCLLGEFGWEAAGFMGRLRSGNEEMRCR